MFVVKLNQRLNEQKRKKNCNLQKILFMTRNLKIKYKIMKHFHHELFTLTRIEYTAGRIFYQNVNLIK